MQTISIPSHLDSLSDTDSVMIGFLEFRGPYLDLSYIASKPGLLAVLRIFEDEIELMSVYQTADLKMSASIELAVTNSSLPVSVAVYYAPELSSAERAELANSTYAEFECAA